MKTQTQNILVGSRVWCQGEHTPESDSDDETAPGTITKTIAWENATYSTSFCCPPVCSFTSSL